MNREVVILGGGIAGLSAAIHAILNGLRPIVLEKNRHAGGRLRSFESPDIKRTLDNGQHVLSAAYAETIQLLKTIGTYQKIYFQKNFNCLFLQDPRHRFIFRAVNLPAPLHFFIPLIAHRKQTQIETRDYINFVHSKFKIPQKKLENMTVSRWLELTQQSDAIREFLWKPFTLAMLNTPIQEASASLLLSALKKSFLHSRKNARLGLPRDWLSEIFIHPAIRFIQSHGGRIHFSKQVQKIIFRQDRITHVVTRSEQIDTPWLISAIPPYQLYEVLDYSIIPPLVELKEITRLLRCSPIITINIFLKEPIHTSFPIAPIMSPLQWIFPHPVQQKEGEYGYAIVSSHATSWIWRSHREIIETVRYEFHRLFGYDLLEKHGLKMFKIIKEKRATILQSPVFTRMRPETQTPIGNFFLAGDWISTGLPATIESAVLSGRRAVEAIVEHLNKK